MAMAKAEMAYHRAEYGALMSNARSALQEGRYGKAVELASSCWNHIDGMMQYDRKYEDRAFDSIEAIDIVLKYAPLLLDSHVLDTLDTLLKSQRRIDKHASDDLAANLSKAKTRLWDAYRLWDHLERNPECRQDDLHLALGGEHDQWRFLAETWEKMEVIRRTSLGSSYRVALSTHMEQPVLAKCSSCGAIGTAPKAKLLEEVVCPKCRIKVLFVLLPREASH